MIEQEKENRKVELVGATESNLLGIRRNKEISIKSRIGLVFGD